MCAAVASDVQLVKLQLQKLQQSRTDVAYHQQVRARRRALQDSDGAFGVGTLVHSESSLAVGLGLVMLLYMTLRSTHFAEIYLGIPAQRASVIVDTGSHMTALPCSPCDGCGQHTDPLFNVSKSTTARFLACHEFDLCQSCEQDRCLVSQGYTEGSMWQAVMIEELVWIGGFSSRNDDIEGILETFGFRLPVGCQTKETGLFVTQKENGIMGLGRHHSTVLSYMLQAGRVTHNVFTLCFAGDGGELVLGGVDYSHHTSDVGYTPLLDATSAYYPVHVKQILVNGKSVGIDVQTINSGRGVIIDSGTTDTFFDKGGNRNFMKAFRDATGGLDYSDKSMEISEEDFKSLPTISIILSGMIGDGSDDVQLDIPASNYFTLSEDGKSYFGTFHFSERSGGGTHWMCLIFFFISWFLIFYSFVSVLGASTMAGFNVIFDAENKRVGFAESRCGTLVGYHDGSLPVYC
ncbi:hypothetical protein PsorP6_009162 [Peronosclerospora sorghi]|uniref:Uncharacterized protein n=1 Tax=Peronosclerospora sorghi TaxID=230839 RepID=A0ACC0VZK9_9STRA|nr:hypothetical protein PsorP6_009162 [Peronosclerospora sorghi]